MFAHLLQKDLVLGNSLERLDEVGVEEEPIIDIVRHHLNGEGEGGGGKEGRGEMEGGKWGRRQLRV